VTLPLRLSSPRNPFSCRPRRRLNFSHICGKKTQRISTISVRYVGLVRSNSYLSKVLRPNKVAFELHAVSTTLSLPLGDYTTHALTSFNLSFSVVRLLTHFMYRNHQCLVFEMLSLNLYELLKNTQFGGVSLNLIRKFAKQVLKSLLFLAREDVDIIHCDLKPENILLRHPKKSGVKVIDFGSSCRSNRRMYSYIQSRFYRSPEVMLGLPYSVAIDMWSLGCILAEMHTGEPLFSGSDQFDQMQKIIKILGMIPENMLGKASNQIKTQFFEPVKTPSGKDEWTVRQTKVATAKDSAAAAAASTTEQQPKQPVVPSTDPTASLMELIRTGNRQKKKFPPSEAYNSERNYEMFVDLVHKMLSYEPSERIKPFDALNHPFLVSPDLSAAPAAAAASTPEET
jgi:dual specificity tyrosine-phosphorylation-regulated kinase 1